MKCPDCEQTMREAKDGFFCVKVGCERWVPKEEGKPSYFKFTWAIPGGGWVYADDGACIGWFPMSDIVAMKLRDATGRW